MEPRRLERVRKMGQTSLRMGHLTETLKDDFIRWNFSGKELSSRGRESSVSKLE